MALLLLSTAGSALAAGPQAGPTRVTHVQAFQVDGKVTVDVSVAHPDARAAKVSRRATNRGEVGVTVRASDGTVLARRHATARLPVQVRGGRRVVQTYRFALPQGAAQQVAGADAIQVQTAAASRLDPDGPGPAQASTNRDGDTALVTVSEVDADPPLWTYRRFWFTTSASCDIEDDHCDAGFDGWHGDQPFRSGVGTVKIDGYHGAAKKITLVNDGSSFFEGWVDGLGDDRLQVIDGKVPEWGAGAPYSAQHDAGAPGEIGGPMHLWIAEYGPLHRAHEWRIEGYMAMGS